VGTAALLTRVVTDHQHAGITGIGITGIGITAFWFACISLVDERSSSFEVQPVGFAWISAQRLGITPGDSCVSIERPIVGYES